MAHLKHQVKCVLLTEHWVKRQTFDHHSSARLFRHHHAPGRRVLQWRHWGQQVQQRLIVDLHDGQLDWQGKVGPLLDLLKHLSRVLDVKGMMSLECFRGKELPQDDSYLLKSSGDESSLLVGFRGPCHGVGFPCTCLPKAHHSAWQKQNRGPLPGLSIYLLENLRHVKNNQGITAQKCVDLRDLPL